MAEINKDRKIERVPVLKILAFIALLISGIIMADRLGMFN